MLDDFSWYCLVSSAEIAVTCSILNLEKPVVLPIATWKMLASPWNMEILCLSIYNPTLKFDC